MTPAPALGALDLLALTGHGAGARAPLQERIAVALRAAAGGGGSGGGEGSASASLAGDSPASSVYRLSLANAPLLDRLSMSKFAGVLSEAELEAAKAALAEAEAAERAAEAGGS